MRPTDTLVSQDREKRVRDVAVDVAGARTWLGESDRVQELLAGYALGLASLALHLEKHGGLEAGRFLFTLMIEAQTTLRKIR